MRPTTLLRESATSTRKTTTSADRRSRRIAALLWIVQGLLAALFLFAGGMKLVMPIEAMTKQIALPGPFLRFIGVAEVAGALGLVLPGALRVRPLLTPLAAAGLVVVMIGATSVTLVSGGVAMALFPMFVGVLCASVVYGRWWRTLPREARRLSGATLPARLGTPRALDLRTVRA